MHRRNVGLQKACIQGPNKKLTDSFYALPEAFLYLDAVDERILKGNGVLGIS